MAPVPSWVKPFAVDVAAPGRQLLFDQQVRCGSQGIERYFHDARRIGSAAELEHASQYTVTFDPTFEKVDIHAISLLRDGSRINVLVPSNIRVVQREPSLERQVYNARQTAVLFLPDLRVGDIVESSQTVRGNDPVLPNRCVPNLLLGSTENVHRFETRLVVPEHHPVTVKLHGVAARAPTVQVVAGWAEYAWSTTDTPGSSVEVRTPDWYDPLPWAQVTDFASWSEVVEIERGLYRGNSALTIAMYKLVADFWQGSRTEADFAAKAARFVQDEIRYVGIEVGLSRTKPAPPAVVFERRFGDCKDKSMLLLALLREGGITAYPALARVSPGLSGDTWAPSPAVFNHVIVRTTQLGGDIYYFDPTLVAQGGPVNRARFGSLGHVLVLNGGVSDLEAVPEEAPSEPLLEVIDSYHLPLPGGTDEATLATERTYRDALADSMRRTLQPLTAEQKSKYYLNLFAAAYPGIREDGPLQEEDDRQTDRLRVRLRYLVPKLWSWSEKDKYYTAGFIPPVFSEFFAKQALSSRTSPLALAYPWYAAQHTDIRVPSDFEVSPDHLEVDGPGFAYRFRSHYGSQVLRYDYSLRTTKDAVLPADLETYQAALERVAPSLDRSIIYRPEVAAAKAATGPNWIAWAALAVWLPIATVLAALLYRVDPVRHRRPPSPKVANDSIGGWLVLLGIQLVMSQVVMLGGVAQFAWIFRRSHWLVLMGSKHVLLAYTSLVGVLCIVAIMVYGLAVLTLFFRRKRRFPFHLIILFVSVTVYSALDLLVTRALAQNGTVSETSGIRLVSGMVVQALWILYTQRSRRSQRTFVVS